MNALHKIAKAVLFALLLTFGLNSVLYAQTVSDQKEKQEYKELIQFQVNHVIEQENDSQSFSEVMVGVRIQSPEDVFLAELAVSRDPSNLKEAVVHEPLDENLEVGEFEFVEYDDLFAGGDDGSGSGFGVGVSAGHCPRGSSYDF